MNNWLNLSGGRFMLIISVYTDKFFIYKKKKEKDSPFTSEPKITGPMIPLFSGA